MPKRIKSAEVRSADGATDLPARHARAAAFAIVIVVATLLAYALMLRAGFIWDDDDYVTENSLLRSADGLARIWFTADTPQYYPLVFTTFWIEHALWGLNPVGYHLVNVLLHAANALLVWRLARRLRLPAPWFIGAVFALHPVQVESVAWVTERKNVLSGLFYLLALRAYLAFHERGQWKYYAAAGAAFVAALLSKTVTATLPVVILLALQQLSGRVRRKDLLRVLPLLIVGAAFGLMTAYLERFKVGAEGAEFSQSLWQRALLIAPRAFCFYALKVAWPHPLMFFYPRWDVSAPAWPDFVPLIVLVLVILGLGLAVRRLGVGPLLLLCFSAATLFPALGFLNVYPHRYSYVADHFQYLGCLGFMILYVTAVVAIGRRLLTRGWHQYVGVPVACLVLIALGAKTNQQARVYDDPIRLWEETLTANPQAWMAMVNLGEQYVKSGRDADALRLFERASQFPISRLDALANWGMTLSRLGQHGAALAKLKQVVDERPDDPRALSNYGLALRYAGRLEEAIAVLRRSAELAPHQPLPAKNLADALVARGLSDEAVEQLKHVLALDPHDVPVRRLLARTLVRTGALDAAIQQGHQLLADDARDVAARVTLFEALVQRGSYAEAEATCRAGLRDQPHEPRLLDRLAWLLATCPDDSIRNGTEATAVANALTRVLGDSAPPPMLDTLAAIAAENGDFTTAELLARKALQGAEAVGDTELAAAVRERLAGYQARRPYRLPH